jgi:ATP-binding cassette subfamily B protein
MCDLNLPNYMSEIVNVGIQQNGIEHAAPEAISQNGMQLMTIFMTDDEKRLFAQSYELVPVTDKNAAGEAYAQIYPRAGERLYVKKDIADASVHTSLDNAFGAATWTMINVLKDSGTVGTDVADLRPRFQ